MSDYKAVLISDIHFTVNTLEVASKALIAAKIRAEELGIPLIICGDTLDSKAIMRGECVNRLLEILSFKPTSKFSEVIILVGNHDLINEKGKEHTLNFLQGHCTVISEPTWHLGLELYLIPYISNPEQLKRTLLWCTYNTTLIMHQGVQGAYMGHYVKDTSSLPIEEYRGHRVISGHYHRAQDLAISGGTTFSYVGNPYTLNFGEAKDGDKGYKLLDSAGNLTLVPLNLRKHVVIERHFKDLYIPLETDVSNSIISLKVTGSRQSLNSIDKKELDDALGISNYKLEYIYEEEEEIIVTKTLPPLDILYKLVDSYDMSEERNKAIKDLIQTLVS